MINEKEELFLKKSLKFWDKLNKFEQNSILKNTKSVKYKKESNIYSSELECAGVIIVKSGSVRIYMLSENGKDITLCRLYKNSICILSASCFIKNIRFDINVDAAANTEILLINPNTFNELIENNIYVENFSYKIITERFSDVMWAFEQMLFKNVDERLSTFLLNESNENNNNMVVCTHEDIAKHIGSAREVVTRMLKHFQNEGYVILSRGKIEIINRPSLESLSE